MKRDKHVERFHSCLPMEVVEWELFGINKRPNGMAVAFINCNYLKKRAKAYLTKIRKRVDEIVRTDETLRILLNDDIKNLQDEFGKLNDKSNNDIDIFAHFFMFIAHLLGWAHLDGNFYRTPIFYQTKSEEESDLHMLTFSNQPKGLYSSYKRRQIIKLLLSEGESYDRIALVMGISVTTVKHLEKAEYIDKLYEQTLVKK
jgi:hypothetical protein